MFYFCQKNSSMNIKRKTNIKNGIQRNKLLRYQMYMDEYMKWKELDVPTTVIYRKYIYPKFRISLKTLNNALSTNIKKELKELPEPNGQQLSLF
ncbi:hypothetical protein HMPREF9700_00446 [Bergeyella zoohelcum CCUG 30536]|uniref:Uncharacterized protein n=2 Tax=Bergeyella zoohelcum TaxID=1015 RepID=A0A376BZ50_9FLAO|nr:hypothetical protein HMPREF9700_00446 [Bergeyella zoohelcum CCUG 30536]SSZ46958.1 Uncharacterised protein [Bergeyella zoohelcum]